MALRASTILFIALCGLLVGIKILFDFYPGELPIRGQAAAFTWPVVGGIILLAALGLLANRAAQLPDGDCPHFPPAGQIGFAHACALFRHRS